MFGTHPLNYANFLNVQAYSKYIKSIQSKKIFLDILILYVEEETKQYEICHF